MNKGLFLFNIQILILFIMTTPWLRAIYSFPNLGIVECVVLPSGSVSVKRTPHLKQHRSTVSNVCCAHLSTFYILTCWEMFRNDTICQSWLLQYHATFLLCRFTPEWTSPSHNISPKLYKLVLHSSFVQALHWEKPWVTRLRLRQSHFLIARCQSLLLLPRSLKRRPALNSLGMINLGTD